MKKQPAQLNYFFKDAYLELYRCIMNSADECRYLIEKKFHILISSLKNMVIKFVSFFRTLLVDYQWSSDFFKTLKYAFLSGLNISVFFLSLIFAPIICFLVALIQCLVLIIIMFLDFVLYLFVSLADTSYRAIKSISSSCPRCQKKYSLPTYVCTCGRKHTKLIPSRYGILNRECECRKILKTTVFNGRNRLPGKWVCPSCGYELGKGLQIGITIPVIGGVSSGKTCYINTTICELEKEALTKYNLDFEYKPNEILDDSYEDNKSLLKRGKTLDKTTDSKLKYYQFYLTPKNKEIKNLISICDISGSVYNNIEAIKMQKGLKYADTLLFMVDPLSIRQYKEATEITIDVSSYKPCNDSLSTIALNLVEALKKMRCPRIGNMFLIDIAIVITKCDIVNLDELIGDKAIRDYKRENKEESTLVAMNKLCTKFLIDFEETTFMEILDKRFRTVQYFVCSSLGHNPDLTLYTPKNVVDPTLWAIDKASKSINLKKKWRK